MQNYRNTPIDFNPSISVNATLSVTGLTFDDGAVLAPDSNGYIKLPYSATLFINTGGDIRVTLLNNELGLVNSTLFKNVQGDFHRIIKGIWTTNSTVTELVLDKRQIINK